ncbi:MAG: hypothetical protein KBF43_03340 [Dermatophilaceae bacterium]|nr:hypothetical protein [Dermatophilaceae bacterium]
MSVRPVGRSAAVRVVRGPLDARVDRVERVERVDADALGREAGPPARGRPVVVMSLV